jgi:hypothetical protein
MSARRLSYAALMVAAGLTGVYAEPFPNFEVLTLVVFCSGVLLGARDGALVGTLTELVFSVLNPYGTAHPLVTLSQVTAMALAGVAGGVAALADLTALPPVRRAMVLVPIAIVLTGFFDLLTNLATGMVYGQMRVILIGGIPFSLWHVATNILLFAVIGTPLVARFSHYRKRLSS